MPNLIQTIQNAFHTIADDESMPPVNVLEASACWLYYGIAREAISFEEAGLNTTDDDELKGMLKDAIDLCKSHSNQLEQFMKAEGISLPPVSASKPITDPKDIPLGVKLTDDEISNGLALKILAMSTNASTGASQSVRTDVGAMWVQFLNESLAFGMTLKTKMRKRGWAKIPPAYTPPGS
ncbi:DUF3231 family protein [Ammoniphilus sp. YIM 78166]|uniref:DUF3231 family protein n=1 Tax=Ammoniphilus sp. YIM 78166 TaxID=1644106 RepID=UPI00143063E6|nr:DUF3231 family protein [Ammoniphilus sp. YIM 78166]